MQSLRVLIADDDPLIRIDLRTLLEDLGHVVVGEADNGQDACYLARSLRPQVAVLDIMMPKMSGLEAAAVFSRERLAPVVLLTAYSEAPMVEEASRSGVLAYLVKPFRREEIPPALEIAATRYRELQALEGELEAVNAQVETRRIVGRAKAILAARHNIADREALRRIEAQAIAAQKTTREVAEAIVMSDKLAPLPTQR